MSNRKRFFLLLAGLVVGLATTFILPQPRGWVYSMFRKVFRYSVDDRLRQYKEPVRRRVEPDLRAAGLDWPPERIVLLGLKQEKRLELYAAGADQPLRYVKSWPVLAASGQAGPKLRSGDRQVPEGLYRIESLNPNSRFHLSARIDYPNAADRARAGAEGRSDLGGDIMIHGSDASVGCLAMGDPAAEEIFVLLALTGLEKVQVVLAPHDFRVDPADPPLPAGAPAWANQRYEQIREAMAQLPLGP
ncbi:MAG: L,D-transpeptidase family protein [Planctomycetota bacterium]